MRDRLRSAVHGHCKSIASKVACELTVPPPPAGEVFDSLGKVNVLYTPSTGGTVPIAKDDSKPCSNT